MEHTYSVITVVARRTGKGLQFLVMEVERLDGKNAGIKLIKFPGGDSELIDENKTRRTLKRELRQETNLVLKPDATVRDLLHIDYPWHRKHFKLVWRTACEGVLRTYVKNDKSSILGVPGWMTMEELERFLCESHSEVLDKLKEITLAV